METRKAKLGETHPSTLASMSNLALTHGDQGRREEAESLFMLVITGQQKVNMLSGATLQH